MASAIASPSCRLDVVVPVAVGDLVHQVVVLRVQRARAASSRKSCDALGLDPVEVAAGAGVDRRDLVLDRPRLQLVLVERLDEPLTAGERGLGVGVEVRAELGERLELAVLRELEAQAAGDLLHRLGLRVAAHARHRDADVDGRAHARAEQVGLEEDLAVGDRDDVRRDVGRHVAGLRLDDRQRGERAAAELVVQLHRALEQAVSAGRRRRPGRPRGPAGGAAAATSGGRRRRAWSGRRRRTSACLPL